MSEVYVWIGAVSYTLAGIALVGILSRRRQPAAAVLWMVLVLVLPLLGVLLYFVFGRGRLHRKRLLRRSAARRRFDELLSDHYGSGERAPAAGSDLVPFGRDFVPLSESLAENPWLIGNRVELLLDGAATFDRMLEEIGKAESSVHLQTYIFRLDATGTRFVEALAAAAGRGVEVRLLLDAIGSYHLGRKQLATLEERGIALAWFHPTHPLKRRFEINFRNHRKNLIIDGRGAFVGGHNIGDEYLGIGVKPPRWRDTHVYVGGPAARQVQEVFLEDWYFATATSLVAEKYLPPAVTPGETLCQVVSSGPDNSLGRLQRVFFAVFTAVRERLDICVPYFLPDDALLHALLLAARRGVRVRILLPFWTDQPVVRGASLTYYAELLRAGVELYEYEAGILHAKVVIADGIWSTVGSCNLDPRSLVANFETNLCVLDRDLARALEAAFEDDLRVASRVRLDDVAQWPLLTRVLQNFYALFSPLL